jgi:hypothetical protein
VTLRNLGASKCSVRYIFGGIVNGDHSNSTDFINLKGKALEELAGY